MLSAKWCFGFVSCLSYLCSEISFLSPAWCVCGFLFVCFLQAALQVGGHGERLHQCREVTLLTYKSIPMQVDGEPCRLAPSLIRISLRNQANMVQKSKRRTSMPLLNEWVAYVHVLTTGGPCGAPYSVMDFACTGLAVHLKNKFKKNHIFWSSFSLYFKYLADFLLLFIFWVTPVLLLVWCSIFLWCIYLFREVSAGLAVCPLASDGSAYVCHLPLKFFDLVSQLYWSTF